MKKLDAFFGVSKNGSTIRTEIIAGIVTFLAMSYILTLNPSLITGDWFKTSALWASVFIATAFGAVIGTLLMALVAKMPLAQAPGLGLNGMVGGMLGATSSLGFNCSFGNAMFIVLISGIIFLLLSVIKINGKSIREAIFRGIPECIRKSISIGIGLFIAFIGLVNAGIVVVGNGTLVTLCSFNDYTGEGYAAAGAVVCLFGVLCIAVLDHFKVKGSVIISIILATLLNNVLTNNWKLVELPYGWKFWEYFKTFFSFEGDALNTGATFFSVFTEGFTWAPEATVMPIVMTVISFSMIDMFDTMGTAVGCAQTAGLVDKDGVPYNYDGIMISDSVATCTGAMLGTSTVTTFVESGSGVAAGGRTGLTALSTAVCFALSIFIMPLIATIPSAAASCALVYVGALMFKGVKDIKLDSVKELIPAFITAAAMPLTYSITNGIGLGILSYVVIEALTFVVELIKAVVKKEAKPKFEVSVVALIVTLLFVVYFFVPTSF